MRQVRGLKVLDRHLPEALAHKHQRQLLPLPCSDDGDLLDVWIILLLEGDITPVASLLPAQEVFGKDQKPHLTLLPDELTHRLLHRNEFGLSQYSCDLQGHQAARDSHNGHAYVVLSLRLAVRIFWAPFLRVPQPYCWGVPWSMGL